MNDLKDFTNFNGNYIHPTAIINWDRVSMGTGNIIYPYACIGTDAQHPREDSNGVIEIGDNNIFREYVTVHLPTAHSKLTQIGNVRISNNTVLSGHVHVMNHAVLGLNCNIHQFQVIGSYAMLGMGTVVGANNKIVPGKVYIGSNAKGLKENTIGLERNNVTPEILESEIARFEKLYEDMHT